jgi:hypothetical protein
MMLLVKLVIKQDDQNTPVHPEGVFIRHVYNYCSTAGYNCRGCELWARENQDVPVTADPKTWQSILKGPDFGKFMGKIGLKNTINDGQELGE